MQNILEVPKIYIERWIDFKRFVLDQAKKDINAKSNLILLDIKTFKTGRKITDLEFIFDYKNNDKRIGINLSYFRTFKRFYIFRFFARLRITKGGFRITIGRIRTPFCPIFFFSQRKSNPSPLPLPKEKLPFFW
ncbi:replication initiation protein [Helicobacter turcicus]|uniref:replication initiation protein n=1 Tax=Helicobacter turcicus TaxID=2867412 RepID=UPI001F45D733|nr:replication initiation protein [Helicobacter turcicus]